MMACARRYKLCQSTLARGRWGRPCGEALIDRTALIIDLGVVGRPLAARLGPLGMLLMASEPAPPSGAAEDLGLEKIDGLENLDRMLPRTDFVISTATLTPETRGMLNREVFLRMKPSAFVINISRGPIVNEDDLLAALDEGLIAGAGLDVLTQEPPAPDHPLVNHDKVVVTPHTAGVTEQSFTAFGRSVAENVERLKTGRPLKNVANL